MVTRVKICGLTNWRDTEWALECGADAVGFVHDSRSPRYIDDAQLDWLNKLPPFAVKVAVFGKVDRAVHQGIFDYVQGAEWDHFQGAAAKRIHAFRLQPGQKAQDLVNQTVNASALLLDAYKEGIFGGTGSSVDWDLAAEIVQRAEKPVILAGGLTPDNVQRAIQRVRPYAVDVSSGVEEAPGRKDPKRVADFIAAVKEA